MKEPKKIDPKIGMNPHKVRREEGQTKPKKNLGKIKGK